MQALGIIVKLRLKYSSQQKILFKFAKHCAKVRSSNLTNRKGLTMKLGSFKHSFCLLFGTIIALISFSISASQTGVLNGSLPTPSHVGKNAQGVPKPPMLNSEAYVLISNGSGKIIAQKNAQKRMAPASLTKMLTLYIASEALKNGQIRLEDKVRVSHRAWAMQGSKMFLKEGQLVSVEDLIQGIIVDSGNDACITMAEHLAGSEKEFVKLMNEEAQRLGMKDSHFTDCTGMPNKDHYSTAMDLAILANALIENFPEYYHWYSQKWFTFNGIKQPNRNRLLWRYKYADGIKTGHTKEAGYCLAASAEKDKMRLVAVVMGAPTDNIRADATQRLLSYGFRFFKTYKIYGAGKTISQPRVWKGTLNHIAIGIDHDLIITIPYGQYNQLKVTTTVNDPMTAPIHKGENVGTLKITLAGKLIAESPLVALQEVSQGGMWTRFSDSVSMSIHNLLHGESNAG